MLFLIDEDVPRSLSRELNLNGYKALDVRDSGLRGRKDSEIFSFALQNRATIITADIGFAGFSFLTLEKHSGLILLRLPNDFSTAETNKRLLLVLSVADKKDIIGNIVVIEKQRIRIRRRKI